VEFQILSAGVLAVSQHEPDLGLLYLDLSDAACPRGEPIL
jgi:hypothetical protein